MFRQIVVPDNTQLKLQVSGEYVSKRIEIIAFILQGTGETETGEQKYSLENAMSFFKKHPISMKDYKFNREKIHER